MKASLIEAFAFQGDSIILAVSTVRPQCAPLKLITNEVKNLASSIPCFYN